MMPSIDEDNFFNVGYLICTEGDQIAENSKVSLMKKKLRESSWRKEFFI